jgi:hypothetical protein
MSVFLPCVTVTGRRTSKTFVGPTVSSGGVGLGVGVCVNIADAQINVHNAPAKN